MTKEEAIRRIKSWNLDSDDMEVLSVVIPELHESEDDLIEYLTHRAETTGFIDEAINCRRWIAYLEKQKEELPTNEEMLRTLRVEYEKGVADTIAKYEQKEQKPANFELKAGNWYICHRAYCCRADSLTVKEGERFQCEKDGVVKGFIVKEPEKYFIECSAPAPMEDEQKEQISTRLNGVMQEYVKEGKDEEEQEHRLKCYKLFWDALEDSEFFEQFKQKEQKPTEWSEKRIADVFEKVGLAKIVREQENVKLTNAVQSAMIELSKVENAECADDVVEEAEEYTSKVACGEYGVEVTEAYINGVLSERNRGTEWSEFDKGCLEDAICAVDILGNDESFNKSNPNLAKAFRVAKDWLKSLPLNLKKKNDDVAKLCSNEWSKEDEKIAKEIEEELWYPGDFPDYPSKEESELYDDCQRRLDWFKNRLKSLRPQPKQN